LIEALLQTSQLRGAVGVELASCAITVPVASAARTNAAQRDAWKKKWPVLMSDLQ
jgi:hypothetical protein